VPKSPLRDRTGFGVVVRGLTDRQAKAEARRCLQCDELCDICVSVCPNRANVAWSATPRTYELRDLHLAGGVVAYGEPYRFAITQTPQTLNIGDWCNECGNCATFCPTAGRPYLTKPKLYLSAASFAAETAAAPPEAAYFWEREQDLFTARLSGTEFRLHAAGNRRTYSLHSVCADVVLNAKTLAVESVAGHGDGDICLGDVAGCVALFDALRKTDFLYVIGCKER
jgi:ferredoxin